MSRQISVKIARLLTLGIIGVLLTYGYRQWQRQSPVDGRPKMAIPELAAIAESEYLNTVPEVAYVGQQVCAECHDDAHRSYLQTAHSRALSPVDVAEEPPDGEFYDETSKRLYRVFRRDDQLWHQESLRTSTGAELVLAEYPMRWVIGSGRFSRSYLVEPAGFLMESPVTWYAARPGWALSPGYDRYNSGFERPVEIRCIQCHVGRAETIAQSSHRIQVHGQAIDCERCHGPGALHVARRSSDSPVNSELTGQAGPDLTIVHPGRLDRDHSEAICAQCHLHSAAMVEVRGRRLTDFRPGLRLNDFSIPYGLESPTTEMHVVGHMEQMRLSRCYEASETLTCITCHDPHHKPEPAEQVQLYRSACLQCHAVDACGLDELTRKKSRADDSCVACHMPETATEIPHFAFTHHRIGIHDQTFQAETAPAEPHTLLPLADVSHLPKIDQDRCLGLAYVQVSDLPEHLALGDEYRERARWLLEDVRNAGLRDSAVDAALARLYWQVDPARTIEMAESALAADEPSPEDRATALFTLATTLFQQGSVERARTLLEELVQVRRYGDGWNALSICRQQMGDLAGAVAAAREAAEISPTRPEYQQRLAELYGRMNRGDLAAEHQRRARQLAETLYSR